jgi:hypothetical protein
MNSRHIKLPQLHVRIAILFATSFFYLCQLVSNWPLVNWAGFRGETRYIDLVSVIKSAECFKDNSLGIYSDISETPCNGYMYGRTLIYLIQILRIRPDVSLLVGGISALLGIIVVISLLFKSKAPNSIILVLSVTPGLSLLFERGNIDLFVFFATVIAAIAFRFKLYSLSIVILLIVSTLKFYTFPLVFVVILLAKQPQTRKIIWTVFSAVIAATMLDQITSSPKVPGTWFISFGMQVFGEYINLGFRSFNQEMKLHWLFTIIIGLVLISTSALLKIFFSRTTSSGTISDEDLYTPSCVVELVGLFSFIVFISCYLTGISYDYRIIFYVLAICGMPSTWFMQTKLLKPLVILSLLCSTIFSPSLIGERVIFQLAGDLAMLLVIPFMVEHYMKLARKDLFDVKGQ